MRQWRMLLCNSFLCGVLAFGTFTGHARAGSRTYGSPAAPAVNIAAFRGQGQLAFTWGGRLYLLDGDRGTLQLLPGATPADPTWSPDGRWLAYLARPPVTGSGTLWVVRQDGSRAHALGGLPGAPQSFAWASHGHTLDVTVAGPSGATGALWSADPSGQPRPRLIAARGFGLPSPDGTTLAYEILLPFKDPLKRREVLYTRPVNGGRSVRRLSAQGDIQMWRWWPDSAGILYRIDPQFSDSLAADGLPLYTLRLGAAPHRLPVTLGYEGFAAFSPSGRSVLLVAGGDRETWTHKSLQICGIESAVCRPLPTQSGTVSLDVDWAPRGAHIAYVQARDLGPISGFHSQAALLAWVKTRTLWVANADGTGMQQVAAAGKGIYLPQWSGDGRHILFIRDNALWLIDTRGRPPTRVLGPFPGTPDFVGFYGHVSWPVQWVWDKR